MAKVYVGPAGVPQYVRRAKSTVEAVKVVRELGLNALEVEFVQGVRMGRETARQVGKAAQDYSVRLSVHAPYFINLCSDEAEKVERSKERLRESLDRAYHMGAAVVVVHAAYYGREGPEACYRQVKERLAEVYEEFGGGGVSIGVEVTARNNQFGSLEEVLRLARELPFVKPVVDWGHLFARQNGRVDYSQVLDLWARERGNEAMHTHFTAVRYRNGKYVDEHEPLERNAPPFEPLAAELARRDLEITLICETPLLDKDALLMKEILERHGVRLA